MTIDKPSLRSELRDRRRAFVFGGRSPPNPPGLFLNALRPGMVVASYVPIGCEADPAAFEAAALYAGATLAWPVVVDRESPISFHPASAHGMVTGPFGLRQPAGDLPAVIPDIILTPLVGFDSRCNRLGQGAGHYDRAFASWPEALRIGIAWSVQQVADLPCDPWDMPLDAIVTEAELILPGGER
ncbi:5-formyltetrahydrofolate cyclo-ligase [Nostoc sp. 3335mG]|nr:5-formyltetrahydrofolate cyclo-ligase [Nostoc sp. 3335mG]